MCGLLARLGCRRTGCTVDVLEDGPQSSLVVYSTEITPDDLAGLVGPSVEGGVQGLKAHLEGGR